jgi:hypothetical protein
VRTGAEEAAVVGGLAEGAGDGDDADDGLRLHAACAFGRRMGGCLLRRELSGIWSALLSSLVCL